jgi:Uma2 family endonuclease
MARRFCGAARKRFASLADPRHIRQEMALTSPNRRLSEAQYLAMERAAEFKSEFFDGEMFAMAGGSRRHSLIASNLIRELGNQLKGRPCVVFNSDLRIKIEASGLFTYPDVSVVCGPSKTFAGADDTLVNPVLLGEVLSDSTEAYDRGKKSEQYRQIPSLREYLLISQKEPHVELMVRQEKQWILREASGLDATIELPALAITLSLSEIYLNVVLVSET